MPCPSCVEVIVIWLCALSLLCKRNCVLVLCLASCLEVGVLKRGVVYSKFVIANSSVEVPFMGGPM